MSRRDPDEVQAWDETRAMGPEAVAKFARMLTMDAQDIRKRCVCLLNNPSGWDHGLTLEILERAYTAAGNSSLREFVTINVNLAAGFADDALAEIDLGRLLSAFGTLQAAHGCLEGALFIALGVSTEEEGRKALNLQAIEKGKKNGEKKHGAFRAKVREFMESGGYPGQAAAIRAALAETGDTMEFKTAEKWTRRNKIKMGWNVKYRTS